MTGFALRSLAILCLAVFSVAPSAFAQMPAAKPKAETPKLGDAREAKDPEEEKAKKDFAAPESAPIIDLTHRYRFIEQYTKVEDKAGPGLIGQYQVGIMEILRDSIDQPDGTKKETEITRQTIYTERPAEVSGLGSVNATIRKYSRFLVRPDDVARTPGPRPLDGLTLYYRPRAGEAPEVMSLSEDRRLREREYDIAARQVFVPALSAAFPAYPARVGDTWRVSKRAVQALLGEGAVKGDNLLARFAELRREEGSKRLIAVVSLSGRVANAFADTAVNARIEFTFEPPAPPKPASPGTAAAIQPKAKPAEEGVVDAKGAVTELRMARVAGGILPDATQRLKYVASQELVLRRRFGVEPVAGLLKIFDAPPMTDVNSWITYVDPSNRFFFHHPQDLLPPERFQLAATSSEDSIVLLKNRNDGKEMVRIDIFRKSQEPDALQDVLNAEWKRIKAEVLPGPSEWLPENDFPAGMKVYRIEAALKLGTRGARMHYDAYLVKPSKDVALMIIATSSRDSVEAFRRDVERMIKTFRLGPVGAF